MGTRRSQGTVTQPSGAGNEENQLGFQSAASQAAKSKAFFCAGAEKWEDAFKERGVLSCSIRGLDSHSQILPAAAELAQGLFLFAWNSLTFCTELCTQGVPSGF